MNISAIKAAVRRALSTGEGVAPDVMLDCAIDECFSELTENAAFRFLSARFDEPPAFLQNAPYSDFLSGARGCFLVACTLGVDIDRRLHRLSLTDPARMTVLDACANAYLEQLAEERAKALDEQVSHLFCPGYGGSDVRDLRYIFELLQPFRIGITLNDSGLMIPQKSMAGIVAVGIRPELSCLGCVRYAACRIRKDGKKCN